jgi:hypothetical protein
MQKPEGTYTHTHTHTQKETHKRLLLLSIGIKITGKILYSIMRYDLF